MCTQFVLNRIILRVTTKHCHTKYIKPNNDKNDRQLGYRIEKRTDTFCSTRFPFYMIYCNYYSRLPYVNIVNLFCNSTNLNY